MTTPCSYKINDHNASNNPIIMLLMFYILYVSIRFIINLICKYTRMFNTSELDEEANMLVPIDSGDQRDFLMTVVRHGKATYASADDGGALTDLGEKQAKNAGLRLTNIKFDLMISSNLGRARETAEIIVKENKYINKPLTICKKVRERDYGALEPFIFWIAKSPLYMGYSHLGHLINIPGVGESVDDLKERVRQFLLNLQLVVNDLDVEDPQVLVVSHASFLTEMHNVLTGELLQACGNTAVSQYQVRGAQVECRINSCQSHLKVNEIDDEMGRFVHDVEETFSYINEKMIKFGDNLKKEISKAGTDMKQKMYDSNGEMVKFGHDMEDTFVHAGEEIIKFGDDMKEDISRVVTNIKEDMLKFGDNLKEDFSKAGTDMKQKMYDSNGEIIKFGHNMEDTFVHAGEEIIKFGDDMKEDISRVVTNIKEDMDKFGDNLKEEISKAGTDMKQKMYDSNGEMVKFGHDIEDTFVHAGEKIIKFGDDMKEDIRRVVTNIKEDMVKFGDNLKEEISKAWTDMKQKMYDSNGEMVKFGHNIEDTFVHAGEEIIKFGDDMKEDISRVVANIKEAHDVEDTLGHINEDMIKFGDNLKEEISKVGTDMKEKNYHIEEECDNGKKLKDKCKEKSNDGANLDVECDSEIRISVQITGGKLVKLDAQSNQ